MYSKKLLNNLAQRKFTRVLVIFGYLPITFFGVQYSAIILTHKLRVVYVTKMKSVAEFTNDCKV